MSPVPTAGEVIEISWTMMDPATGQQAAGENPTNPVTAQKYDSFVVATIYGSDQTMDNFSWELLDLYGNMPPYSVSGSFAKDAYNVYLDTAQKGTNSWV